MERNDRERGLIIYRKGGKSVSAKEMLSFLVLLFEILILGIAESFGVNTVALSVVFIGLLSVCLICEFYRNRKSSEVWLIFVCGYLWRLFLLFWDLYCRDIYVLPHANSDDEGFFAAAIRIMRMFYPFT